MTTDDPCCPLCATALGVCRSNHQCQHHRAYERAERYAPRITMYRDDTGDTAAANADKEQRAKYTPRRSSGLV